VLQTAFYPEKFGKAPRCAIYFVGWNDLRNAHIPNLDPAYADFHLPSQVDSLKVRRVGGSNVTISPLLTVLARLVSAEVDTVRYGKDPYALPPAGGSDPAQAAIFERNVRSISAINRTRGTPTLWVGQVVNRDRLKGDGLYGWLPRVRDRDLWPLLQQSNALLERTGAARRCLRSSRLRRRRTFLRRRRASPRGAPGARRAGDLPLAARDSTPVAWLLRPASSSSPVPRRASAPQPPAHWPRPTPRSPCMRAAIARASTACRASRLAPAPRRFFSKATWPRPVRLRASSKRP